MRLVVADTSPIFYLLAIEHIDILPQLFGKVFIPEAAHQEWCHAAAPRAVRQWAACVPGWIEVAAVPASDDALLHPLDDGERSAIMLPELLRADLIPIDERKGTTVALTKGFYVTGILSVLDLAARRGLVNLPDALVCLQSINLRYPPRVMDALIKRYTGDDGGWD